MTQIPNDMTDIIDLSIEDQNWVDVDIASIAETAVLAVIGYHDVTSDWSVSILACDDQKIKQLNGDFRDKDRATNVLSWPEFDIPVSQAGDISFLKLDSYGENSLGDIALSYETCVSEAKAGGISLAHHCHHLLIHGCLHLLGYDHETDADATRMEGIESLLLVKEGIRDPYK